MQKLEGEAGIYVRDDGRYHVHTTAKDPYTGEIRHKRATLKAGATLEDARATRKRLKAKITSTRAPLPTTPSVLDYSESWLEAKVGRLKPSSRATYLNGLTHLGTHMGGLRMGEVVRHDVERFVGYLERLEGARVAVPDRYAEIVTLAYTGMRPGELYGLTWEAVDLDGQMLEIHQAVSAGVLVDSTKTEASRVVPIPEIVVEALRPLQRARGLVFPSDVGTPRWGSALAKALVKAANAYVGPWRPIGPHVSPLVLRRTLNTLLTAAGVDRIVQRSMMGHSSEEMTERYSGVRMEDKRRAMLRVIEGGG